MPLRPATGCRASPALLEPLKPNRSPRHRFELKPLGLLAFVLVHGAAAQAQQAADAPALKPSPRLREEIPSVVRRQLPTFVFGDRLSGRTDLDTQVEGHAELRRGDIMIRADRLD